MILSKRKDSEESEEEETNTVDRSQLHRSKSLTNVLHFEDINKSNEPNKSADFDFIDTNVTEKAKDETIKVFCRFRPFNEEELKKGTNCVTFLDEKTIQIVDSETTYQFAYNKIFLPETTQQEIYKDTCNGIVEKLVQGFNAAVLAYGQTGTGKTFTMMGKNADDPTQLREGLQGLKTHLQGITPRLLVDLFDTLQQVDIRYSWSATASYLEIYNENLNDLLLKEEEIKLLEFLQNKKPLTPQERIELNRRTMKIIQLGQTVAVSNATQVPVRTHMHATELLMKGAVNRVVAATNSNKESSRSHAIFIITIEITEIVSKNTKKSQLYLVDLAGSEQVAKTKATGARLDEAKMINKSLFELGNVIKALSSEKIGFVPYRNSKLTRLLQNSIGGNSSTTLIINCSPSSFNASETLSTLRFGDKTKAITNRVASNRQLSAGELLLLLNAANQKIEKKDQIIKDLQEQIHRLQFLSSLNSGKEISVEMPAQTKPLKNNYSISEPAPLIAVSPVSKITKRQSSLLRHLTSCYCCPISNEIMTEPFVASDGFTYEKKSIEKWLLTHDTSPILGTKLQTKLLYPNRNLKEEMAMYLDEIAWYKKTLTLSLNDQPQGVLLMIFSLLDVNSICRISCVCKRWKRICDQSLNLWFALVKQDFNVDRDAINQHPKAYYKYQYILRFGFKKKQSNTLNLLSLVTNK